mgnify:CR=1 FL=1
MRCREFFDMHIHLSLSGGDTLIDNAKTPVQQALDAVKFAQDSLMAGFTTLRDVGSYFNVAVELRDAINAGKIVGPNIIASGKIVTPTENGNDFLQDCIMRRTDRMKSEKQCAKK